MTALYQITSHHETMERGLRAAREPENPEESEFDVIKAITNIIQSIRSYLF